MPRLTAADTAWMRRVFERNRAPYTKTIVFTEILKERGILFQLYILCCRALTVMKVRFNLNGRMKFSRHADAHVTFVKEPLETKATPEPLWFSGRATKYRLIHILGGNVEERIVHYTETWYTEDMYVAWEDSEIESDSIE